MMNSIWLSAHPNPLRWIAVGLAALALVGCVERRDPYAEFLQEQREKAIKQLEQYAQRDNTLDILCWDIRDFPDKSNTIKKWATSQKGLDVMAFSGPNLDKIKQAADMADVINSFERGWPVVMGSNEVAESAVKPEQYAVMNANGHRFDGVETDPIEGWQPAGPAAGRQDPPSVIHLQRRYTDQEVLLVYLTNSDSISDTQWSALSKWIDKQTVPVIVFGQFDASRLKNPGLLTIDPQHLVVSKSIETWQFRLEQLQGPFDSPAKPYMIHCEFAAAGKPS